MIVPDLPPEIRGLKEAVGRFVEEEVYPVEARIAERGSIDRDELDELRRKAREAGFAMLNMPTELGGRDLPILGQVALEEESGKATNGLGFAVVVVTGLLEVAIGVAVLNSPNAALHSLGEVALKQRDYITVRSRFQTVLTSSWDSGDKEGVANVLTRIAAAFRAQGQLRSAATLGGAAETLYESIGIRIQSPEQANHNPNLADLRKAMGENQFATFWTEGRAMTMDLTIQYALAVLDEDPDTLHQTMAPQLEGLTTREREIVLLIAQGKSNRAIAEELVISEKTAERHVANILSKLGFHSRTQIATWAVEKGASR